MYLSGKFCSGEVMRTLLTTLYSNVSQCATRSTTTSLANTGSICVGIPCQKCNKKFSTYEMKQDIFNLIHVKELL